MTVRNLKFGFRSSSFSTLAERRRVVCTGIGKIFNETLTETQLYEICLSMFWEGLKNLKPDELTFIVRWYPTFKKLKPDFPRRTRRSPLAGAWPEQILTLKKIRKYRWPEH